MAAHPQGSRTLQVVFEADSVASKLKKSMTNLLLDHAAEVACNKYGSHVIDTIWAAVELKCRINLAEALRYSYERLMALPHGRIIVRNCRLDDYRRRYDDWLGDGQAC
jgi:hypothetical protein